MFLKMLMIIYNEALDNEVMEIMQDSLVKNYTKITKTFGRGESSGIHLGTDIWPGLNNIMYVACQEPQAKGILLRIKELKQNAGQEGIRVFVLPLEEV